MEEKIRQVKESFEKDLQTALQSGGLSEIRIKYLGKRRGLIPALLQEFRAFAGGIVVGPSQEPTGFR